MAENTDLFNAQYETMERETDEDFASYIIRFIRSREQKYSSGERKELARMQMDLQDEKIDPEAVIDEETLLYLEGLIATRDYSYTYENSDSADYRKMRETQNRLVRFFRFRLKKKGLSGKPFMNAVEILNETEKLVKEIAPIKDTTARLRAEFAKILKLQG